MIAPDLAALLMPAQILLVGRRGGISDVIRVVTNSRFSHVALIASSSGAWIVVEATTDVKGVAARQLEVITDDPTVEHLALLEPRMSLAGYQRELIVKAAWLQTNEAYSQRVNLDILLHVPADARHGVNCALMAWRAYNAIGLDLIDAQRPTPQAWIDSPDVRVVWTRDTPQPDLERSSPVAQT